MNNVSSVVTEVLKARFPDDSFVVYPLVSRKANGAPDSESKRPTCGEHSTDQHFIRVSPPRLIETMRCLRDDARTRFEQLIDLTCVDYLHFPDAADRYGVVYSLLSLTHGHRLWIKCFVNDPKPSVPTVTDIWPGAEWMEREVFDMFGIVFDGHPDLRRILTWDGFEAHPLRKDYPLRGKGERENYPVLNRESA